MMACMPSGVVKKLTKKTKKKQTTSTQYLRQQIYDWGHYKNGKNDEDCENLMVWSKEALSS